MTLILPLDESLHQTRRGTESSQLQAAARRLIHAVTWEAWSHAAQPPTRDQVRIPLTDELRSPGSVLSDLATAEDVTVAEVARATLSARCWAVVEGGRNIVVVQALMSLDAPSRRTAQSPHRSSETEREQITRAGLSE